MRCPLLTIGVLISAIAVFAEEADPNYGLKAAYERFVEAGTWQERAR